MTWLLATILIAGEALLLFLTVDTSQKRLGPARTLRSPTQSQQYSSACSSSPVCALSQSPSGSNFLDFAFAGVPRFIATCAGIWLLWGAVFYLYTRNAPIAITRILSWLLRRQRPPGSLIAISLAT